MNILTFFAEYWFHLLMLNFICGLIWLTWRLFRLENWRAGWHDLVHEGSIPGLWAPCIGVLFGFFPFYFMIHDLVRGIGQKTAH
jgi:hypothetical protein